jgi:hypothetical protein
VEEGEREKRITIIPEEEPVEAPPVENPVEEPVPA